MAHKEMVIHYSKWLVDAFIPFAIALDCRPSLTTIIDFGVLAKALNATLCEERDAWLWVPLHIELEWLRHVAGRDLTIWDEASTVVDLVASCVRIGQLCDDTASAEHRLTRAEHLAELLRTVRYDHSTSHFPGSCVL